MLYGKENREEADYLEPILELFVKEKIYRNTN